MTVTLRPWTLDDGPLLEAANTPEMTAFLGGPEPAERVADRNLRYAEGRASGTSRMSVIEDDGEASGSIGYWPAVWRDALVAFPNVENAASNRLCARTGFTLAAREAFTFRGAAFDVNAWLLELAAS